MRKIKLVYESQWAGCNDEIIKVYPDDVTDEDIEDDLQDLINKQGSAYWEDTDEDPED